MGLLGTLLKGVGKVAKAGLSVATKGASDKVLSVLKGIGQAKRAATRKKYLTAQMTAQIAKRAPAGVKITAHRADSVLEDVAAVGTYGRLKTRHGPDAPPRRRRRRTGGWESTYGEGRMAAGRKRSTTRQAARRGTKRRQGKGRRPPTGGLNLKALSASWRAAGKPGRWLDWVKANR